MTAEPAEGVPPPFDPYRPPEAVIAGTESDPAASAEPAEPPPFFSVSPLKLAVMSIATLQVYHYYWFYKHWRQVNVWRMRPVSPVARAIFSPLFAYSLFAQPGELARSREVAAPTMSSGLLALAYFLTSVLAWRLPPPADMAGLLAVLPLLVFQWRVRELHAQLGHDPRANRRFTGWNVLAIVVGGLLWLLLLVEPLLPAA